MEKVKIKSISVKYFNNKQLTLLKMSVKSLLCGPRFSLYQPRPQGAFPWLWGPAPPPKPGKSALGTRLSLYIKVYLT